MILPGCDDRPWLDLIPPGPSGIGAESIEPPCRRRAGMATRGWVRVYLGRRSSAAWQVALPRRVRKLISKSGFARRGPLVLAFAGLDIPAGFEVHHADGDKRNDRLDNLALVHKAGHARRHSRMKPRDEKGRWVA